MASRPPHSLYSKKAEEYASSRPTYPDELYEFIFKHLTARNVAWDVGTGNGQAAIALSKAFSKVVATDASPGQLEHAQPSTNISYILMDATICVEEAEKKLGLEKQMVDLISVAQAMHWFDLDRFYALVNHFLRRPNGALAAWCYGDPHFDSPVLDVVCGEYYERVSKYWDGGREHIGECYKNIAFPFRTMEGLDSTGPFNFCMRKVVCLEDLLTYFKSGSGYQKAMVGDGIDLLDEEMVHHFEQAWGDDVSSLKTVYFPLSLRLGRIALENRLIANSLEQ